MEQVIVTKNIKGTRFVREGIGALLFLLLMFVFPDRGLALTPAGTVIGNQATATYNDSANNSFTAQSNLFSVTVSQVAGVSQTPSSQTLSGAAGNQVQFPHTVKNTGNGTDTFNLTTATGGAVTLTSVDVVRDDNGDGLANAGEPIITSVALAMDQSQTIVVRGTIPSSAANGSSGTITLTATSVLSGTATASSTDTASVVTKAVISLSKADSAATVNPGGTLDYTINYTNVGVASTSGVAVILDGVTVTRHVVRDLLPSNTTFNAFLGTSTPAGGTLVYHATGAAEDTYVTTPPGSIDAVGYLFTTALTGGQSGVFSFRVTVNASAQVQTISNTAVMKFHDSTATTSQTSNTTSSTVNLIPLVTIRDTDPPADDIQVVASGNAGSAISFTHQVQNTGNGSDRFNITVANVNFPSGTTFALFAADGVTPLLDTNSDGTPDTGSLAASTTLNVIMKATVPANATSTGAVTATLTARSVANSGVSDTTTAQLSAIVGPGVDLTNIAAAGAAGALGTGAGPEGTQVVIVTANPSATANIDLHVKNTGPSPDTFALEFSNLGSPFTAGALPTGISKIEFFAGDNSGNPTGAPITSTGQLAAGTNKEIIATVTVSSSVAGATNINIYFRAISTASAAADIIRDGLTVNTVRGITLSQNQTGQTSPGSAATYSHVLKNIGNVTEPSITLAATNSQSGFLTTIYQDVDGDGLIDSEDTVITSVTSMAAGTSTSLIIRVAVPSSAANGTVDTMTLTATPTGTVNGVAASAAQLNTDQTTVVTGQIELTLSASPSGSQPPGTQITYTVSYQNVGAAAVSALVITDAIPANTTYVTGSMVLNGTALGDGVESPTPDAGELISGSKGSVRFTVPGSVSSGATGTASFKVAID